MGTTTYPYTPTLNRVASQVADTCGATVHAPGTAVNGETLQGHAVRVLNVHDRQASVGTIRDRGALLGDQRQSIHALNQDVLSATAYNRYRIRPLRIGSRQKFHGLVDRFFPIAIHG